MKKVPVKLIYKNGSEIWRDIDVSALGFTPSQWEEMSESEKNEASTIIEGRHFKTGVIGMCYETEAWNAHERDMRLAEEYDHKYEQAVMSLTAEEITEEMLCDDDFINAVNLLTGFKLNGYENLFSVAKKCHEKAEKKLALKKMNGMED